MCGIAGAEDRSTVKQLVDSLQHRGRSTNVNNRSNGGVVPGHVLHPVVNHVEQPLQGDGILVANCEIYNWRELRREYAVSAENDADLLLHLLDQHGVDVINELDGVYAFAYLNGNELVLARDVLGVNPVWYTDPGEAGNEEFAFASERQALEKQGFTPRELHPRQILTYDLDTGTIDTRQRDFFSIHEHDEQTLEQAAEAVKDRFVSAVEKRVPASGEVGLLFSGGVDSTMVAAALQELDVEFTCYTAGVQPGNTNAPKDVDWAERVADKMGLDLQVNQVTLGDVESSLPQLTDWISSTSTVKLGVALPFHFALEQCDADVVFSGLGSEQLYAGYDRHDGYLNKECLSGLRRLWERDLYRDNVVTMRHGAELRVPFLEHALVEHALTVPGEYKVKNGYRKYVLRKAAELLGVPKDVAWRGKTAAQYGSNFDKALARLAKNNEYDSKQAYLNTLRNTPDYRLAALSSGGKDSNAALYRMARRNNDIRCLINLQSANPDSYMFDTKETELLAGQAEQLAIPLLVQQTEGEKEAELADLQTALERAKQEYGAEGVVAGALASTYQRDRVEQVAETVGLKVFAPLWQEDPAAYMRWLVREGFQIQITETAARGLDDSWEGRTLDAEHVEDLITLAEEYRFNAAGEGGEYETVVAGFPEAFLNRLHQHGDDERDQD